MENKIKVKVYFKEEKHNSVFEAIELPKKQGDYGPGNYVTILRNGEEFKLIDCRYFVNYTLEAVLMQMLNEYFGENLVKVEKLKGARCVATN